MLTSRYYHAPHLYELAFVLPPQRIWRARAFKAILEETNRLDIGPQYLLDIGSGAGVLAKMIALQNPCTKIKAIDSSCHMAEYARKIHGHPSVEYVAQSFWDEDGEYDVVTAAYCWHFFPLPKAALKLKEILKAGGNAFIVATTETPVTRMHRRMFTALSSSAFRLHSPEDLAESLKREGFSVRWRHIDRWEGSYLVAARLT
jgi:ubiquinone/menaquinone biosynthesis C-methylase UbiE